MADFANFAQFTGEHNTTLPTLSDAQASPLQLDSSGRLIVAADIDVNLDHTTGDSVQVGDGTDVLAIFADGSITVRLSDGTDNLAINGDGSINAVVTATDLDIRDLDAAQDNVAISDGADTLAINANGSINVEQAVHDQLNLNANVQVGDADATVANPVPAQLSDGTDTLAINADGSINVVTGTPGTEADASSDPGGAGDGLVDITVATAVELLSIAVGAGVTYRIHGWSWASDLQGTFRLEVRDGATLVETVRVMLNASTQPGDHMVFSKPIEIAGAATRVVRATFTRAQNKDGAATAGINGDTV